MAVFRFHRDSTNLDRVRAQLRIGGLVLVCALLSLVYLLGLLRFDVQLLIDVVDGSAPFWSTGHRDVAQALIGFEYYVNDEWRLPLFFTPELAWPRGTNIVFTDSVPAFASVTKLINKLGWDGWGLSAWFLLLVVMQSLATNAFLFRAGIRDGWFHVCGVLIALSVPVFLFRFAHMGLASHFLLILALALYAGNRSPEGGHTRTRIGFAALLAGSLMIHVYLAVMVFAIFFATEIRFWRHHRRFLQSAGAVLAMQLWCLTVMLLGGHLADLGLSSGTQGYGFYSLNLMSLVVPQMSALFPWNPLPIDATGGQYEGYGYLGAGVIVLVAFGLVARTAAVGKGLREHWPLVLVLVAMTLFALSNVWYWGDNQLVSFPLPRPMAWFTGQFRSSGRFVWPTVYVLVLGTLVFTAKSFPGIRGRALVVFVALLQIADTQPLRDRLYQGVLREEPQFLDRAELQKSFAGAMRVLVYPPYPCAPDERVRRINVELLRVTAGGNIPTNNVMRARLSMDCDLEKQKLLSSSESGVVTVGIAPFERPVTRVAARNVECRRIGSLDICRNR